MAAPVHAVRLAAPGGSGEAGLLELVTLATLAMLAYITAAPLFVTAIDTARAKCSRAKREKGLERCSPVCTPSGKSLTGATSRDRLGA
jgi:hypothetical protein